MKISVSHERTVAASPEQVAALIADFDLIWPTHIAPAPRHEGPGVYDTGLMVWEEFSRRNSARAFHMIRPDGLEGEHWFDLRSVDGGTQVRHRIEGRAEGKYAALWSERIEPLHERVIEALLDNIETALGPRGHGGRRKSTGEPDRDA